MQGSQTRRHHVPVATSQTNVSPQPGATNRNALQTSTPIGDVGPATHGVETLSPEAQEAQARLMQQLSPHPLQVIQVLGQPQPQPQQIPMDIPPSVAALVSVSPSPSTVAPLSTEVNTAGDVVLMTRAAVRSFNAYLKDGDLASASKEYKKFVDRVFLLELVHFTAERVTTKELDVIVKVIDQLDFFDEAHAMGGIHYYDGRRSYTSSLREAMRFVKGVQHSTGFASVFEHYAKHLRNEQQRESALKGMLVHFSWLAPPWRKAKGHDLSRENHVKLPLRNLLKLLDSLHGQVKKLNSTASSEAFRKDVLAAFTTTSCSPFLAEQLSEIENIPSWLDAPLRLKLKEIIAGPGDALFPRVAYARNKDGSEAAQPDAPTGPRKKRARSGKDTTQRSEKRLKTGGEERAALATKSGESIAMANQPPTEPEAVSMGKPSSSSASSAPEVFSIPGRSEEGALRTNAAAHVPPTPAPVQRPDGPPRHLDTTLPAPSTPANELVEALRTGWPEVVAVALKNPGAWTPYAHFIAESRFKNDNNTMTADILQQMNDAKAAFYESHT